MDSLIPLLFSGFETHSVGRIVGALNGRICVSVIQK
jgi:hypothetical protein